MKIGKYSLGIGDRFGHQGEAQLRSIVRAAAAGVEIVPVWNKSNREHSYIHSLPVDTRIEADAAVKALSFQGSYYVDADHINLSNVTGFLAASDFFTLDVASGFTRAGIIQIDSSTKTYVYCILGAQAQTRSCILEDTIGLELQQQFTSLGEDCINTTVDIPAEVD